MRPMQIASLIYSILLTVGGVVAASSGVIPDRVMKFIVLALTAITAVGNQLFPRSFTKPTGAFTKEGLDRIEDITPPEQPAMRKLPEPPK